MPNKLEKEIAKFSKLASIISLLCTTYNDDSVKPFIDSAQVYKSNYRSSNDFMNVIRNHKNLMKNSIRICYSLFENYEELKQKSIYEWSWHLFNLLNGAKKVMDEIYILAYTVGRDDTITTTQIQKETNPLVQIQRHVILDDGDFEVYKKSISDWKCNIQALYVEEKYMEHIVEMCNARKSKYNPKEAKINACKLRKSITLPDDNKYTDSTPNLCILNAELILYKSKIELLEKENKLTVDDINIYIIAYTRYQRELITFVFINFSKLYNETCVKCLRIFLEQQHGIVYNLIQKRKSIASSTKAKYQENTKNDNITWDNDDINKITSSCSNANNSCKKSLKIVGSLN